MIILNKFEWSSIYHVQGSTFLVSDSIFSSLGKTSKSNNRYKRKSISISEDQICILTLLNGVNSQYRLRLIKLLRNLLLHDKLINEYFVCQCLIEFLLKISDRTLYLACVANVWLIFFHLSSIVHKYKNPKTVSSKIETWLFLRVFKNLLKCSSNVVTV